MSPEEKALRDRVAVQLCNAEDAVRLAARALHSMGLPVASNTWSTLMRCVETIRVMEPEDVVAEIPGGGK